MFDVGGKKIDRKKWNTTYDDVRAVLFCIAVSEYDQTMTEDGVTVSDLFHPFAILKYLKNWTKRKKLNLLFINFANYLKIIRKK